MRARRARSQRLRLQISQNLRQRTVRQRADFIMRAVLNRMLNEYHGRIIAERLALRRRRDLEFRGRNPDRHNAEPFEPRDVMHTARRAGASISQAFDDEVAFGLDLLFELKRRQMGEVLLAIAFHCVAAGRQQLVKSIEKFIAAHLGDVE